MPCYVPVKGDVSECGVVVGLGLGTLIWMPCLRIVWFNMINLDQIIEVDS